MELRIWDFLIYLKEKINKKVKIQGKNADVVELIKHTIGKYGVSDSNAVITF